ncbi:MAG: hypothetical protein ABWZ80_05055 [Beijerinckiaceae bacterium]
MSFALGRLPQSPACGPACVDFIVADGEIGFASALAYLLARKRIGDRDVPVLLNSPGGYVAGATNLGRMWRKLGVTVVVASAEQRPCGAAGSAKCNPADEQSGVQVFDISIGNSECASACPFALAGATARISPPGASIGIHETYVDTSEGVGRALENMLSPEEKERARRETERELALYAEEMGIDPEIASRSMKTRHSSMEWLPHADVARYRLTTGGITSLPAPIAAALLKATARPTEPTAPAARSNRPAAGESTRRRGL